MFLRLILPSVVLLSFAMPALAQQDATIDAASILKELDAIEKKGTDAATTKRKSVLDELRAAATNSSAADNLYLQAIEATQFEGRRNDAGAFSDWRKERAEDMRSKEWQTALQLHIKYLLLSIQSKDVTPEVAATASLTYVNELVAADPVFQKQMRTPEMQRDLLDKSISDSIFTKWLRLEPMLPSKDWEMKPGNLSGILDKNVRGPLRDAKNATLLGTWDFELKIEAARVTSGRLQHQADQFNNIRKPQILFQKAKDYAALGQPNRAAQEMLLVIKAYPQHPNFPDWARQVRELLNSPDKQ